MKFNGMNRMNAFYWKYHDRNWSGAKITVNLTSR